MSRAVLGDLSIHQSTTTSVCRWTVHTKNNTVWISRTWAWPWWASGGTCARWAPSECPGWSARGSGAPCGSPPQAGGIRSLHLRRGRNNDGQPGWRVNRCHIPVCPPLSRRFNCTDLKSSSSFTEPLSQTSLKQCFLFGRVPLLLFFWFLEKKESDQSVWLCSSCSSKSFLHYPDTLTVPDSVVSHMVPHYKVR